jgi:regulator of sigma E protease
MAVALSDGPVEVGGYRPVIDPGSKAQESKRFDVTILPEMKDKEEAMFPQIKIERTGSLKFTKREDGKPVDADSVAAKAVPPIEVGDELVKVAGLPVKTFAELQRVLADTRSETITLTVRRGKQGEEQLVEIGNIKPAPFRTVGLQMDIGKIVAIQKDSPADGKLQVGDKITHVITADGDQAVGDVLDPLELPDVFYGWKGTEIKVRVQRQPAKGDTITEVVTLTPDDRPGWTEKPDVYYADGPLSIPAIGVAYHVLHTVIKVDKGSEADKAKIKPNDIIDQVEFLKEEEGKTDERDGDPIKFSPTERNWAQTFELMQRQGKRIRVTLKDRKEPVILKIYDVKDWYRPVRGLAMGQLQETCKAKSAAEAVVMGGDFAKSQVLEMYLMLRRLASGKVSKRALGGPITIFKTAYFFAEKGVADLFLFLGILSVSLAVLNFLPIPVLDGGHFVFLLWEGIRGKPASVRVIETATYVGLLLLLTLMGWVMYLDIGRLIGQ